MDVRFLIDVNLPYFFGLWNSDDFVHQNDIDPKADDLSIWEYARERNLTIVTKDSDFSNRILLHDPPPKVIHIKLGNLNMKAFYEVSHKNWETILEMNASHKLVNVYKDQVEGIQ
jgi:predicted nuclease of predicted toxin-antitoxin system